MWYSRFSHVTKIQTKKLSVLLSFFFHEALQHLNTLIYWNFWFERVPPFAIEGDWIFRLLRDAAFSGRPGKLICWLKTLLIFNFVILLSEHSLSQNKYNFNIYEFLKQWIHSCVGKLKDRCFCRFPAAMVLLKGTPTWCLHTKPYKFGYNAFPNISHNETSHRPEFLARPFVYLYSFISQILDSLFWMVCIFIFDGVIVKTEKWA